MEEKTPVIQYLDLIWKHENTKGYARLNAAMQKSLSSLIQANVGFAETDFKYILSHYGCGHWIGLSLNGNHWGESFYSQSCQLNKSAAISYEKAKDRTPFLLNGKRVHQGFDFKWAGKFWHVTGWEDNNEVLRVVGYENRNQKGKRKLESFDRKRWLEERKNFQEW